MATYTDIFNRINEMWSRVGRFSIGKDDFFLLLSDVVAKQQNTSSDIVSNLPDNVDLEAKNNESIGLKDNSRNGYVVRSNADLDLLIGNAVKGRYVIASDIVLDSAKVLPEDVVLDFKEGQLAGTITGNNTEIKAPLRQIFDAGVDIQGTWRNSEAFPEWFGAKGDGATDDVNAFRTLFSSVFNNVKLLGNYLLSEPIPAGMLKGDGLSIVGQDAEIKFSSQVEGATLFPVGSEQIQEYSINNDIQVSGKFITLSSVDGLSIDDVVAIKTDELMYNVTVGSLTRNTKKGELVRIKDIVGDTIEIYGSGVAFAYNNVVNNNARIIRGETSKNVNFSGIKFVGPGSGYGTVAINSRFVRGLSVENCQFEDFGVACEFSFCESVVVRGNKSLRINKDSSGYTVSVGSTCKDVIISNNVIENGRHGVTTSGEQGFSMNVLVDGNVISRTTHSAIDTHNQGKFIRISNNKIKDCFIGVQARSANTIIEGNSIINCSPNDTGNMSNVSAIMTTESGSLNLIIVNNELGNYNNQKYNGANYYGSAIDIRSNTLAIADALPNEFIIVKGNNIFNFPNGDGISYSTHTVGIIEPKLFEISDNTINKSGYSYVNITGIRKAIIRNNTFLNQSRDSKSIYIDGGYSDSEAICEGNILRPLLKTPVSINNFVRASVANELPHSVNSSVGSNHNGYVFTNVTRSVINAQFPLDFANSPAETKNILEPSEKVGYKVSVAKVSNGQFSEFFVMKKNGVISIITIFDGSGGAISLSDGAGILQLTSNNENIICVQSLGYRADSNI